MNENNSIPQSLRDLFESGKADEGSESFVPPTYSLFFFGLMSVILFGLGGTAASAIAARGTSLFQLEPDASMLGPIIAILMCVTLCVFGFWFFWQWVNAFKRRQLDKEIGFHSGIRFDRDAITVLYHSRLDREESFCIAKDSIGNVELRTQILFRNNRPGANGSRRSSGSRGPRTRWPVRRCRRSVPWVRGCPS